LSLVERTRAGLFAAAHAELRQYDADVYRRRDDA